MADASPFAPTDTYDDTWAYPEAQQPAGHPARLLKALRDKLPEENKSLPKPQFFMDPRATSLVNMVRGSLDTAGRWLGGTTRPDKLKDEDMLGPLGGAGVAGIATKGLASAPTQGHLSGFIGPGQVDRLNLTPGSRGSLGALEKAQETWAKGGTDPGALAETWSKHGWAPPESFGVRGNPFSWLEMPDLRIRDDIMDMHQGGGTAKTEKYLGQFLEPNRDLDRLLQSTPELANAKGILTTSPGIGYNGLAGVSANAPGARDLKAWDNVPPANIYAAQGANPVASESILLGHELRGHGMPVHGGTQIQSMADAEGAFRRPLYGTRAEKKIDAETAKMRGELNGMSNPFERRVMSRAIEGMGGMKDQAAKHAAYFADPQERMARHAHILDQLERGGQSPFKEAHAPGVMSTYGPRALVNDDVARSILGSDGIFGMRDLTPPVTQSAPFRRSLAPVD